MTIADIVSELNLRVVTGHSRLEAEVTGGYVSDLLSDVMANTRPGDIWITLQVHPNAVAVASMNELCGILIIGAREPLEEMIDKAEREQIPILATELPAFEVAGRLFALGIRGTR